MIFFLFGGSHTSDRTGTNLHLFLWRELVSLGNKRRKKMLDLQRELCALHVSYERSPQDLKKTCQEELGVQFQNFASQTPANVVLKFTLGSWLSRHFQKKKKQQTTEEPFSSIQFACSFEKQVIFCAQKFTKLIYFCQSLGQLCCACFFPSGGEGGQCGQKPTDALESATFYPGTHQQDNYDMHFDRCCVSPFTVIINEIQPRVGLLIIMAG